MLVPKLYPWYGHGSIVKIGYLQRFTHGGWPCHFGRRTPHALQTAGTQFHDVCESLLQTHLGLVLFRIWSLHANLNPHSSITHFFRLYCALPTPFAEYHTGLFVRSHKSHGYACNLRPTVPSRGKKNSNVVLLEVFHRILHGILGTVACWVGSILPRPCCCPRWVRNKRIVALAVGTVELTWRNSNLEKGKFESKISHNPEVDKRHFGTVDRIGSSFVAPRHKVSLALLPPNNALLLSTIDLMTDTNNNETSSSIPPHTTIEPNQGRVICTRCERPYPRT